MSTVDNAPTKRRAGRPKASATTTSAKPRAVRGASSALSVKNSGVSKKGSRIKRQPLTNITNTHAGSETEEVDDDFDILSDDKGFSGGTAMMTLPKPAPAPAVKASAKVVEEQEPAKPRGRRGRPRTIKEEIPETQPEPEVVSASSNFANAASANTRKARPAKREVIPETQSEPDRMVIDESLPPSLVESTFEEPTPKPKARQTSRQPSMTRERQTSVARERQTSVSRKMGMNGSDTERGGNDPTLRRKVGDLTKKLETLELKYENLHAIGVRDADTNFEKLKKQTELKSKAADDLISSLRAELTAERNRNNQSEKLRAELETLKLASEAHKAEKKALQTSLNESKNEIKGLQAKLAAARSSSVEAPATSRVPGSAIKTSGARTIMVGAAEGAKEAQKRHLKEELYRDLTGLLVMDVKRRETEDGEEDVFDCIQTGRNGSLHFHLAVAVPGTTTAPKTPGGGFDDTEFQYEPKLNDERDRDLLDILPDYLTEDICFPRSNAAKFYARVVDCLTKKIEVEEEESEVVSQVQEE